jgi:hypothetical protein
VTWASSDKIEPPVRELADGVAQARANGNDLPNVNEVVGGDPQVHDERAPGEYAVQVPRKSSKLNLGL